MVTSSESCVVIVNNATSSNHLKRKRPPKIEIPSVLQEIQTDRLPISTPLNDEALCFSEIGVGVFSVKGKKKFMEDTHKIVSCSQGTSNRGFFGVYDGHGGKKAAEFVAENLHKNIFNMMENCKEKEDAVRSGYMKTDQDFLKQGLASGACCVTALIEGKKVLVSNLGDCRAVLCRGGAAEALTKDHRVEEEDERKRIENKGGYVEIHRGAWRVHGVLSVSRSIGDYHLKDWVSAEPDTKILQLTSDMEFLVLASDGLWEKVSNQETIDMVKRMCWIEKGSGLSGDRLKENDDDYTCINASPSSKLRRILLVKQPKDTNLSLSYKKSINNVFHSLNENESPSKSQRKSLFKRINMKNESPTKEMNLSPGYKKSVNNCKDGDFNILSENESPPSKSRRISLVKRINMKTESSAKENSGCRKRHATATLVSACKELVNIAVERGSLDDITVMIIDLKHFTCNRESEVFV